MAVEVRRALAKADTPPWETPSSIDGMIDPDHVLPPAAVDAIWRITNQPGTLTEAWYQEIVAGLPSAEHYVELVSVVATINSVDRFAEIVDLEPLALPVPTDGEPTRESVNDAGSALTGSQTSLINERFY